MPTATAVPTATTRNAASCRGDHDHHRECCRPCRPRCANWMNRFIVAPPWRKARDPRSSKTLTRRPHSGRTLFLRSNVRDGPFLLRKVRSTRKLLVAQARTVVPRSRTARRAWLLLGEETTWRQSRHREQAKGARPLRRGPRADHRGSRLDGKGRLDREALSELAGPVASAAPRRSRGTRSFRGPVSNAAAETWGCVGARRPAHSPGCRDQSAADACRRPTRVQRIGGPGRGRIGRSRMRRGKPMDREPQVLICRREQDGMTVNRAWLLAVRPRRKHGQVPRPRGRTRNQRCSIGSRSLSPSSRWMRASGR